MVILRSTPAVMHAVQYSVGTFTVFPILGLIYFKFNLKIGSSVPDKEPEY
jgi:hypothetical protein